MAETTADPEVEIPDWLSDPLSTAIALRDRETIAMVRRAVETQNVTLAFQPVVHAGRPDRIAFQEGLLRVLDSSGRVIPAAEFIPAVERTELGRQLDCRALEMGLAMLAREPGLRLSVNMSARSIGYPPWMDTLRAGLSGDPTVGERLILEITESSAMVMPDTVQVFMADLQAQGIAFALDDFGAGYTAFRYLRDFYFDIVKIDGQFIRNVHADADNQVLTEALISIARHFEMFTVAENVECAADADFLRAVGIDCMQGFHFGAPALGRSWLAAAERRAG